MPLLQNAQFAELGVIDRRKGQFDSRGHSARGSSGVGVPLSFPSVGFVYPSAPLSRWIDSRPLGAQTQECRHRPGNRARRRRGRLRQRPSKRRKSRPRRRLLRSRGSSGVVVPLSFPSVGFVYPSAPSSRSQSGCVAPLPPLPAVLRLESYRLGPRVLVGEPRVLVGEETDSGLESSTAAEGRHKPPPSLYKCFIAHVEGGAAAHISSMTSSWFDSQSEWEGRDEEREVPLRLVCGWTMNSWVFGSISLIAKVSPSR